MRVVVSDFLTVDPPSVRATQSARAAAKLMRDHETQFLVVMDHDAVMGVVTAHDLAVWVLEARYAEWRSFASHRVAGGGTC